MAVKSLLRSIALLTVLLSILSAPAFSATTSEPSFNELRVLWDSETPLIKTAEGNYQLVVGPFTECSPAVTSIEAVMHFDDNTWGKDIAVIFK